MEECFKLDHLYQPYFFFFAPNVALGTNMENITFSEEYGDSFLSPV